MRVGEQGQGTVEVERQRIALGLLLTYGLFWCVLAVEPVNRHDWFLENLLTVGLAIGDQKSHRGVHGAACDWRPLHLR